VDDAHDGPYAREPQVDDLVRLGKALSAHGVRYVLIGGFAVIAHGGARATKDIDLLIDEKTARPSDAADRQFRQALIDEASR
jgi:hypothetical protein